MADREIARMAAIVEDYRILVAASYPVKSESEIERLRSLALKFLNEQTEDNEIALRSALETPEFGNLGI